MLTKIQKKTQEGKRNNNNKDTERTSFNKANLMKEQKIFEIIFLLYDVAVPREYTTLSAFIKYMCIESYCCQSLAYFQATVKKLIVHELKQFESTFIGLSNNQIESLKGTVELVDLMFALKIYQSYIFMVSLSSYPFF